MCNLTEKQRCEFADRALAARQAMLSEWHQREQRFARWIAHQRSKNNQDVQLELVRQLKKQVAQRADKFGKQERQLMSFLSLPKFRKLNLRKGEIAPNSTVGFVDLPDLPAFKGEPLDTRFLNLKG
ncbi:hypothetical protein ACTUM7_01270 [Basfia succiniciproducens]|uniref:hypothetical protein n=1 Tax=Basfia succiniciproducens TaxID=653940 RepID=UPI003FCCBB57